jgi:RimJ/RimL family protein N-acetyltransferase
MQGRFCRLVPVDVEHHGQDLYQAFASDTSHHNWTYLPYGPFDNQSQFNDWLASSCLGDDPLFHTIVDLDSSKAVGMASYLRIEPAVGVIETGHIHYSPLMQRTPIATETMYLMMRRVFEELGYRRYEWKCDSLNAPSRNAAARLGFQYEGLFRQATMYKGRNRDTAWFSILDTEWPALKAAFEAWLQPDNFDADGKQKKSLADLHRT